MALALDAMPIGLIIIGSDGRVSYANAQAARWDRVPARQWVGQPLQADCPGWLSATNAAVLRQAVVDRVPMQLREGTPSIELVPNDPKPGQGVEIASWMLQPGEAEIVAGRIEEVLGRKA